PTGGSGISEITVMGDRVFFVADDGVHGRELWASDGTADGTQMVKDIAHTGIVDQGPADTTSSDTPSQDQTDGTTQDQTQSTDQTQTQTVATPPPLDDVSSDPSNLVVLNGKLYFAATDAKHGRELWVSDGTTDGTTLLKNINVEVSPDD